MRIRTLALAVMMSLPMGASANIQQQVNSMFGTLINTTGPGSYQTATRGVVTGGGVVLRNRISTANLISITPPSAKGGCGGINLYSGSFSFINGEEFVALMRNVASNAVGVVSGFAFEAALEAMDPQTAGVIRNLANKIQSLNQMFSNSCQLAQGIVTGGVAAFKERHDLKSAMTAFGDNVAPDFFSSKSTKEESPAARISSAGKAKACINTGNIIWCAMKKGGLASQILFGSDENAEFIMSMVGSYYIKLSNDDKGGKNFDAQPMQRLITDDALKIFVQGTDGTDVDVYQCDEDDKDQCLEPNIRKLKSFVGLEEKIVQDVQNSGVFERFAAGQATPADGNRLKYLASSRIGVHLFKIIQKAGPEKAYDYFREFSRVIAVDAAYSVINQLLDETEKGLTSLDIPETKVVISDLRFSRERITDQYHTYRSDGTTYRDADRRALEILQTAPVPDDGSLPQGTRVDSAGQ